MKARALKVAVSARERERKIRAAIKADSVVSAASARLHADLLTRVAQHFDSMAAGNVKLQVSKLTADDLPNRKPSSHVRVSFSRVSKGGNSGFLGHLINGARANRPSFHE